MFSVIYYVYEALFAQTFIILDKFLNRLNLEKTFRLIGVYTIISSILQPCISFRIVFFPSLMLHL